MAKHITQADIRDSVEAVRHAVSDGIGNGADAVRAEAEHLKAMASKGASDVASSVSNGLQAVSDEKDVIVAAARQQGAALEKIVAQELRTHPIRSLGIAAAIGLLAGYLSSR